MAEQKKIVIIGGSGFLGRAMAAKYLEQGHIVRIVSRHPEKPFRNWQNANLEFYAGDILDKDTLEKAFKDAHSVIYSVGLLDERGDQTFQKAHVDGPRLAAERALAAKIQKFILVSAIGADENSQSRYAQTKAQGELAVRELTPQAVIVRPSIIFGKEDNFFNQFNDMAKTSPALPLIGGGVTQFQPVHVDDVATAVLTLLDKKESQGIIYEFGGPDILTFKQCLEKVMEYGGRKRFLVNLPFAVAHIQAKLLSILPQRPITKDQLILLKNNNIVSKKAKDERRTINDLDIMPASVDDIVPTYL